MHPLFQLHLLGIQPHVPEAKFYHQVITVEKEVISAIASPLVGQLANVSFNVNVFQISMSIPMSMLTHDKLMTCLNVISIDLD